MTGKIDLQMGKDSFSYITVPPHPSKDVLPKKASGSHRRLVNNVSLPHIVKRVCVNNVPLPYIVKRI